MQYLEGTNMGTFDDLLKSIAPQEEQQSETALVDPIDYGNGVLYFDCIRDRFAKSLSAWIGAHKNAIVVAVAPNLSNEGGGPSPHCEVRGYIVVVYYTKNK